MEFLIGFLWVFHGFLGSLLWSFSINFYTCLYGWISVCWGVTCLDFYGLLEVVFGRSLLFVVATAALWFWFAGYCWL